MLSGRPRFTSHFTPSSTSLATAATTSRGLRRVCAWHSGWRDRALSPGGWTPSARICGWAGAAFLFGLMDGAGGASGAVVQWLAAALSVTRQCRWKFPKRPGRWLPNLSGNRLPLPTLMLAAQLERYKTGYKSPNGRQKFINHFNV